MTAATADSKRRLRLWIKLLQTTKMAEAHLRDFLRVHHQTTLPRFDVMAALSRNQNGISMSDLSRLLLVSNGNVTAIVDRLEKEGLVRRQTVESDRRTLLVTLTDAGTRQFADLAISHAQEVNRFFAAMPDHDIDRLMAMFDHIAAADKQGEKT